MDDFLRKKMWFLSNHDKIVVMWSFFVDLLKTLKIPRYQGIIKKQLFFVFHFNEQQILQTNLAIIISLEAELWKYSAKQVFIKDLQN